MKTFLYVEQHPAMSTLGHILVGGEVPGELAIMVVGTNAYIPAPRVNKFEQTACGCHHKVLANQLFNPHTSHAWHEGVPSFNPGGRKDAVYTGYGRPTRSDFYSSAVTSTIPGKAEQITCMRCRRENTIRVVWFFARLKNK